MNNPVMYSGLWEDPVDAPIALTSEGTIIDPLDISNFLIINGENDSYYGTQDANWVSEIPRNEVGSHVTHGQGWVINDLRQTMIQAIIWYSPVKISTLSILAPQPLLGTLKWFLTLSTVSSMVFSWTRHLLRKVSYD